jgi:hypothetical protein
MTFIDLLLQKQDTSLTVLFEIVQTFDTLLLYIEGMD